MMHVLWGCDLLYLVLSNDHAPVDRQHRRHRSNCLFEKPFSVHTKFGSVCPISIVPSGFMNTAPSINWTNKSVKAFAKGANPFDAIRETSRTLVLKARERGWQGPPFNPLYIAKMLNVQVEANSSIADARLVDTEKGAKIEFNPQQSRERVRFSIAHEVAHSLFPDWSEQIRNRGGPSVAKDDWQLEMLCNLAASEFVLPIGSLTAASEVPPIEDLMHKCRDFDVSVEAFLVRLAKVSTKPIGVFFASPVITEKKIRSYRVDYYVASPTASRVRMSRVRVPDDSVIRTCTAIGHTNRATEDWIVGSATEIECVGIPGYPGSVYPRVAAFVRFGKSSESVSPIRLLHGNVLEPRGSDPKIICQMVNDRATKWGGGVARQAAKLFPEAQNDFTHSFLDIPRGERLGRVIFNRVDDGIMIASMIAQEGFGPSSFPRIRYGALEQCLVAVSSRALDKKASIHMPRIGTGAAGGDWDTIQEMLDDTMIRSGLSVTIYDLPPKRPQLELF